MAEKKTMTKVVSMRLHERTEKLLDRAAKLAPSLPRLALARVALELGLEAIIKDPKKALG